MSVHDLIPPCASNVYEGSDTAVLTLSAPVEYTETIRPVCLPADPADTFVDRVARCTGWGGLLNGGFPDELMEVDVKVISNDECRNSYYRISE